MSTVKGGLKIICDCGTEIQSFYTYFINALDISYWTCEECGQTFHISIEIQEVGEANPPEHPKEYNQETVRFKCEKCGHMNSHGGLKYVNRLPSTGKWRCAKCGMVYLVRTKIAKGGQTEVIL